MTTSIETARQKFRWAMLIQVVVVLHTVLLMFYVSMGDYVRAIAVLSITIVLLYAAISIAFTAGTYWPSGRRGELP